MNARQPTPEMTVAVERLAGLLGELYDPAGSLIYISTRISWLNGLSVADCIRGNRVELVERASDRLNAIADGAIL